MDNFIFSLNVTVPIFLVMVLGYVLKQKGMLTEEFVATANKFNFKITLPFLLFRDIAAVDIYDIFDLKFVLFCAIASSVCFFGIWGMTKVCMKEKSMRGAFVQASFRSSAAVMGLAFIQNIYGTSGMGSMMLIAVVPIYNIYSVLVLTFEGESYGEEKESSKIFEAMRNIIKNPIIIAVMLGLLVAFLKLDFPVMIDKTIDNVAKMATPLALVAMGAGFKGRQALSKIKPTLVASFIKLVLQPAMLLPIAAKMGFAGEKMVAILIMLAAPATPSCYIMAKNMKNDGDLTASIVVATTLLSAFTLTGWIFILRTIGWI